MKKEDNPCPFNKEAVVCTTPERCFRCGWNPEVSAERSERIRGELRNRTEGGSINGRNDKPSAAECTP